MIAVDTLVHNFLHRTGILHRFQADHAYGLACYQPGGCAEIIETVAHQIDARQFDRRFPRFPRFVQRRDLALLRPERPRHLQGQSDR
jgi:hypothetical protein